jgi:hypothetical protein
MLCVRGITKRFNGSHALGGVGIGVDTRFRQVRKFRTGRRW